MEEMKYFFIFGHYKGFFWPFKKIFFLSFEICKIHEF